MAYILKSGATSDQLTVVAASKAARVNIFGASGGGIPANRSQPATKTGIPFCGAKGASARRQAMSRMGHARIGTEQILFHEDIGSLTVINTNLWTSTVTTYTNAVTSGATPAGLWINSGSSSAQTANGMLVSSKQFPRFGTSALILAARIRMTHVAGAVIDFGFANPTPVGAAIVDGFCVRRMANGDWYGVIAYNNVGGFPLSGEHLVLLKAATNTDYHPNQASEGYNITIRMDCDFVEVVVDDGSDGPFFIDATVPLDPRHARLPGVSHLPIFFRMQNVGAPAPHSPHFYIYQVQVSQIDVVQSRPWSHQRALAWRNNLVSMTVPTAQLSNWANSAAPTTRTITNTTALETTIGGQFAFNNAGTSFAGAETDLAMFTIQSSLDLPMFHITGIRISAINLGAANAAAPYTLQWALASHSNAVSLATAGTYPPMRLPLGVMMLPASAAVGAAFDRDIDIKFQVPVTLRSGGSPETLHIIVRVVAGTATLNQVIRGTVLLTGYWE